MEGDASGLKVWQKIFYGLGDMTGTISYTIISFLFLYYLTNVTGLDATLAGAVFAVGTILQAVLSLAAGYASDTARSRFGRRRVFFLFTFVPYALSFFLLWIIPAGLSQAAIFFMALVFYIIYVSANAFYTTPYATYSMELEGGYDGRTSLVAYRMFVSIFLGLVAAVLPQEIVNATGGGNQGYMWMGLAFVIPLMAGPLFVFFAKKEEPFNNAPRENILRKLLATLKNRHFVKALFIYVFTWTAIGFIEAFLMYYLQYVLQMKDLFQYIVGAMLGVAILALPLWVFISKKMDKRKAYILGASVFLLFMLTLALPDDIVKMLIWVIVPMLGIGISCMHVLPTAIVPEAIEQGEGKLSVKDQGTHFGVMNFFNGITLAIVIWVCTAILNSQGYIESTGGEYVQQPDSALMAIKILVVTVSAILLIGAIIAAALFRIGRGGQMQPHAKQDDNM